MKELNAIYTGVCCALLFLALLLGAFIRSEVRGAADRIEAKVLEAETEILRAQLQNAKHDVQLAENILVLAKRESARSRHEAAEAHRLRVQKAIERVGR